MKKLTKLTNYTIARFLTQPQELVELYMFYLEELQPKNFIHTRSVVMHQGKLVEVDKKHVCKSLWFLPWDVIDELKPIVMDKEKQTFDDIMRMFELVFSISKTEALTIKIVDYYAAIKFIINGIKNIILVEQKNFQYQPNPKLESALETHKNELEQLGIIVTIDNLAGGDLTKWEQIKKMPYGYVHRKQWKNTLFAKINDMVNKPKTPTAT